jgi:ribosomal protein L19
MLDNPHPDFFRECDKTVEMFIRKPSEKKIYNFFMKDIDGLLENYEPGDPKMKPDVLIQIKEIEAKREQMMKDEMAKMQSGGQIMLQQPGQPPMALNNQQVVELIQQQQQHIQQLSQKCQEFEGSVTMLQKQLVDKTKTIRELSSGKKPETVTIVEDTPSSETVANLESMIVTLQKQLVEKTKAIRELSSNTQKDTTTSEAVSNLESVVATLQKQLVEKTKVIRELSVVAPEPSELQNMVTMLQKQLIEKTKALRELNKTTPPPPVNNTENIQNMVNMLQSQLVEKNNSIRDLTNKLGTSSNDNGVLTSKVSEMETIISNLQTQLIDKNVELQKLQALLPEPTFTRIPIIEEDDPVTVKSKSDPEITVSAED